MTTKQKILLGLLILGLVFSSLVRLQFNLSDGFVSHGVMIKFIPLPLFDYVGHSGDLSLTSTIFGYLFFLLSGVLLFLETRKNKLQRRLWLGFLFIALYATYFEWTSLMQDINLHFIGQHLRMGPVLFLLGLFLFIRSYRTHRVKDETSNVPLVSPTES